MAGENEVSQPAASQAVISKEGEPTASDKERNIRNMGTANMIPRGVRPVLDPKTGEPTGERDRVFGRDNVDDFPQGDDSAHWSPDSDK